MPCTTDTAIWKASFWAFAGSVRLGNGYGHIKAKVSRVASWFSVWLPNLQSRGPNEVTTHTFPEARGQVSATGRSVPPLERP